jgi:hypothetical protein
MRYLIGLIVSLLTRVFAGLFHPAQNSMSG